MVAAFVLDAMGNVVAANQTARECFAPAPRPLVGVAFASLFAVADGGDGEAVGDGGNWAMLKSRPEAWQSAEVITHDGTRRAVEWRLERAHGGAGSYIAVLMIGAA